MHVSTWLRGGLRRALPVAVARTAPKGLPKKARRIHSTPASMRRHNGASIPAIKFRRAKRKPYQKKKEVVHRRKPKGRPREIAARAEWARMASLQDNFGDVEHAQPEPEFSLEFSQERFEEFDSVFGDNAIPHPKLYKKALANLDTDATILKMFKKEIPHTLKVLHSLIRALGEQGKLDAAFRAFERFQLTGPPPNEDTYHSLLHACAVNGAVEEARSLLTRLYENPPLPSRGYTKADSSFLKKWREKDKGKPLKIEGDAEAASSPPPPVPTGPEPIRLSAWMYRSLAQAYCVRGDMDGAHSVIELMESHGHTPGVHIFNVLIGGHWKQRDLEGCWRTFNRMRRFYCEPDTSSLTTMIRACAHDNQTERAISLFDEFDMMPDVNRNLLTFNSIMHACAKSWKFNKRAFTYYRTMQSEGIQPDLWTFNILLHACSIDGDIRRARSLYESMCQSDSFRPGPREIATLLNVYARAQSVKNRAPNENDLPPIAIRDFTDLREHAGLEPLKLRDPIQPVDTVEEYAELQIEEAMELENMERRENKMIREEGQPYIDLLRKYGGYSTPIRSRKSLYVQAMEKGLETALAEDMENPDRKKSDSDLELEMQDMTAQEREMFKFTQSLSRLPPPEEGEDEWGDEYEGVVIGDGDVYKEKPELSDVLAKMMPEEREMMAFAQDELGLDFEEILKEMHEEAFGGGSAADMADIDMSAIADHIADGSEMDFSEFDDPHGMFAKEMGEGGDDEGEEITSLGDMMKLLQNEGQQARRQPSVDDDKPYYVETHPEQNVDFHPKIGEYDYEYARMTQFRGDLVPGQTPDDGTSMPALTPGVFSQTSPGGAEELMKLLSDPPPTQTYTNTTTTTTTPLITPTTPTTTTITNTTPTTTTTTTSLVPAESADTPSKPLSHGEWQEANISAALSLFQHAADHQQVDSSILDNTLKVHTEALRLQRAVSFLQTFDDFGVEKTAFTYGNIVAMFARAKRPERALEWKKKMQRSGHSLSQNLYGRVIHSCAVKGHLDDALALLQEMEDLAIPPPKERQLQCLRELCRYRGVAPAILPEDPLAWERELKKRARNKKRPKKSVRYIGTKWFR